MKGEESGVEEPTTGRVAWSSATELQVLTTHKGCCGFIVCIRNHERRQEWVKRLVRSQENGKSQVLVEKMTKHNRPEKNALMGSTVF
ncbi:hypothetical protein HPP92_027312 [Vanilla planifolia]|uniref:Uncharacterized protein n=1 Tax=Vanilla planifolia TaxID=51239 RepID=A0A835PD81_VANPL|nr:hypothetical protein HPP92_027312 [Vanilla planifolia]